MEIFFILLVVGIVAIIANRMNQLQQQVATIHCLKHTWKMNENGEMYCEVCKGRPE